MENVTKVFFDPLMTTKADIRAILLELPIGSAHPFNPEHLLLCRTAAGIDEIDISAYKEDYFFNAVDLSRLGETLENRMGGFGSHLRIFNDEYIIQQVPASIFRAPIVEGKIAIFAVSARVPTYYDLFIASAECNTSCFSERYTFPGITHSGDIKHNSNLLQHIQLSERMQSQKEYTISVSGYHYTKLSKYQEHNPVVLVANHSEKVLYVIPVPLDGASIGDATICSPMVMKRDGSSLLFSILPKPATDEGKMCSGKTVQSLSFQAAIERATFVTSAVSTPSELRGTVENTDADPNSLTDVSAPVLSMPTRSCAVFINQNISLPSIIDRNTSQVIKFGTGISFLSNEAEVVAQNDASTVILPCILGSKLEGPLLLATGSAPSNVPFANKAALQTYYEQLESVIVVVDDRMTDNARNIATSERMNALFIIQVTPETGPNDLDIVAILNSVNINAVTALAGPQSLVLVQNFERYYFYRGIANRAHLDTSSLEFGTDVTDIIRSAGVHSLLDPRAKRLVDISKGTNTVIVPSIDQQIHPRDIPGLFEKLSVDQIRDIKDDVSSIVTQLQVLLSQKDIQDLSVALISTLSAKVQSETALLRTAYVEFMTKEYNKKDSQSIKKKALMAGELKKCTKRLQASVQLVISQLGNMMSAHTTSKRTHDLNRLVRQTKIQGNVQAAKSMNFEALAGYLEEFAADMGVLLLNIKSTSYSEVLQELGSDKIDISSCCDLDPRVLSLGGFDAGIIIEQSQKYHNGPLRHQSGPSNPVLALPHLSNGNDESSMLAWVCWDEFVNLENPYEVRWMEKCNDPHIAALRIIMRGTLSHAVASRQHKLQPGSIETGRLMCALLMAAISKLAAMRNTAPAVTEIAEDTATKLMRGLFGNLLTIAGSGARPMSMVTQLLGTDPSIEIPSARVEWNWYENVVNLFPFTGWPRKQFYLNLEKLLDKALIRPITKTELQNNPLISRIKQMVKFCKLRNIQLHHSRTIITVFMKLLTGDVDVQAIAKRLKNILPKTLQNETQSYTRMIEYIRSLALGGSRQVSEDKIIANVYTKRSAAFGELKNLVAQACGENDIQKAKIGCQALIDKHAEVASLWHLEPTLLKAQNISVYTELLEAPLLEVEGDEEAKKQKKKLFDRISSDAERSRVPWQIKIEGQDDIIEPLDEAFIHEILTGESLALTSTTKASVTTETVPHGQVIDTGLNQIMRHSPSLQPWFVNKVKKIRGPEDVCNLIGVPATTMRAFVKALNPLFEWDDLGKNFESVVVGLIVNRSEREKSCPTRRLLGLAL
ncbi:hypothetical protein BP5796_11323 [Coleophoma crateriformis]|uniref:Uncharacterized protein n=1 Tax=Coleophoma crateriformis TaxID=565419 RepID=A0A3D8QI84_9HELO|nr:hypothetical protein BP5796_11323 [Coleophoma crateriformis]